jgi:predicted AlkP superfamily phosphohydrolase/phosphomutase
VSAQVLVVGLDAVDPQVAQELAGAGKLPTIASLLATSGGQTLANPDGLFVGAVWPTLFTGTSPGRHGRWWPGHLKPGTYQVRPYDPAALAAETMWTSAARAGRRVAVIDAPHAPTIAHSGLTQLTDWGGHEPAPEGFVASTPELAEQILAEFGPHPVDDCDRYGRSGRIDQLVADLRTGVDRKTELACTLLDRADWDLFFATFTESHCAGHQCWHLHDPHHPKHDPAQVAELGDPIVDVYRRVDAALDEVLARVGAHTEVFVVLSHGMGPHYDGSSMLGEALRRLEVAWHREPSAWATGRNQARHAWNRVARKVGMRPPKTWMLDGSRPFFRAPNAGVCGAIRLNVAGREPDGVVAAGREYEDLCDALTTEFATWVNVETGGPAVRQVLRPEEIFDGPFVAQMPDLMVEWHQDDPIDGIASPTIGRVDGPYAGHRTGDHRRDGMLLRRGPTATATVTDAADARTVAPAILEALEVPSNRETSSP